MNFQDGGVTNLFPVTISWLTSFENINIYLQTTLWPEISTVEILYYYFRFLDNSHIEILRTVYDHGLFVVISTEFCVGHQIPYKSDHPRTSYDILSIFQDGGHGVTTVFPLTGLVTALIYKCHNLPVHCICRRRDISLRQRYYYFECLKQMTAILEFYFRFRRWPTNRTTLGKVNDIISIFKIAILLPATAFARFICRSNFD